MGTLLALEVTAKWIWRRFTLRSAWSRWKNFERFQLDLYGNYGIWVMCIWELKACHYSLNHLTTITNNRNLELCLIKKKMLFLVPISLFPGFSPCKCELSDYISLSELLKIFCHFMSSVFSECFIDLDHFMINVCTTIPQFFSS